MKISKLETTRSFAKKLQKALGTNVEIKPMSNSNHNHFHIKDEFSQDSHIVLCIDQRDLTFSINEGKCNDWPCPKDFAFGIFSKLVAFLRDYCSADIEFGEKDFDDKEGE